MKAERSLNITWLVPETYGGIHVYANQLFRPFSQALKDWPDHVDGAQLKIQPPIVRNRQRAGFGGWSHKAIREIAAQSPDLIHIQHEFGLFGSKNPPFYSFPRFIKKLRSEIPGAKIVATAHTVIQPDFQYPIQGRGWQSPFRWFANQVALGPLHRVWNEGTWGGLDGVITHSKTQEKLVAKSGVKHTATIYHFVYDLSHPTVEAVELTDKERMADLGLSARKNAQNIYEEDRKTLMVFGFFSPDKGQDLAISALSYLPQKFHLVLAGGARRTQDYRYLEQCLHIAKRLGVDDRVSVTGFVSDKHLDHLYARADLVIAPFRETSGSGSIAQALARGAPILASDLPLNLEINERQPGTLATFKAKDPSQLALQVEQIMKNESLRESLKSNALKYADLCKPSRIAKQHLEFYKRVLEG